MAVAPLLSGHHPEHSSHHAAHVAHLTALKGDGVLHLELAVRALDHAGVRLLAAHGGVERGLLHHDGACLAVGEGLHQLRLRGEGRNL